MRSLDPLFWQAERIGTPSSWWPHVPFGHWIVCATRPRLLVELGTQGGVSYTSFCQSVARSVLNARCYAVDTWRGDRNAGLSGEETFQEFRQFHERYRAFSTLLRMTFHEALPLFADDTVDLLHINCSHTYEAIRHDFESWKPKLSQRAVVLLHHTNERRANFGVPRLWTELCKQFPHFEFLHGHGLGVLALGKSPDPATQALCRISEPSEIALVRSRFAVLGGCLLSQTRQQMFLRDLHERVASVVADSEPSEVQHTAAVEQAELADTRAGQAESLATQAEEDWGEGDVRPDESARALDLVKLHIRTVRHDVHKANIRVAQAEVTAEQARIERDDAMRERDAALRERDALRSSTAWLITYPVRALAHRAPPGVRRVFRRGAKLAWWMLTLKLSRKLREHRAHSLLVATPAAIREIQRAEADYFAWNAHRTRYLQQLIPQRARLVSGLPDRPLISVVVPVHDPELIHLQRALQSVEEQIYPHWELVIVDDGSRDVAITQFLQHYSEGRANVQLHRHERSVHIAGATNKCVWEAKGDFVAFLDHDDELTPDALLEIARVITDDSTIDVVYSDHDILGEDGSFRSPYFKPGWSPELLLSYMYLGHLKAYRTRLVREIGGMRDGFEGAADYDLALRITERARSIRHIPNVLYHWRAAPRSMARSSLTKPESFESGRRAVEDAVERRNIQANVSRPRFAERMALGIYQLRFTAVQTVPVTIIVPTKNKVELLSRCIDSIEQHTTHEAYKVLIVDNGSDEPSALDYLKRTSHQVMRYIDPKGFNFAGIVNAAVSTIDTEYFVLLNNDTLVISPDWLQEMLGYATMPNIGAVGAKLLYPDNRIQHAGIILGVHGLTGHAFQGRIDTESPSEYLCFAHVARNYAAVTGACLLSRKSSFNEIGGFDARNLKIAWNDVDYCLRLYDRGLRVVFTPHAVLYHLESQSRGDDKDPAEVRYMLRRWGRVVDNDPFFNRNLSRLDQDCRLRTDPNESQRFYYRDFRCAPIL
jgi:O-antigen biosynthesis protein